MLFGRTKAKVALAVRERLAEQRDGKYIVSLSRSFPSRDSCFVQED
jgi:formyltetrahydrofolate synthetase